MKKKVRKVEIMGKIYIIIELTSGIEEMVEVLLKNKKSYFLFGKPGTGKTYSINKIKEELNVNKLYVQSAPELAALSSREGLEAAKEKVLRSIEYGGYIIIDDLGAERTTSNHYGDVSSVMEELLCETIYREWENSKDTKTPLKIYITSNLTFEKISEKYGNRTMSRLIQMCVFVYVDTEDLRESQSLDFL